MILKCEYYHAFKNVVVVSYNNDVLHAAQWIIKMHFVSEQFLWHYPISSEVVPFPYRRKCKLSFSYCVKLKGTVKPTGEKNNNSVCAECPKGLKLKRTFTTDVLVV